VIIAEPHGVARLQGVERSKDRCVAKVLGDTARIEWVQAIFLKVQMRFVHRVSAG